MKDFFQIFPVGIIIKQTVGANLCVRPLLRIKI